MLVKKQYAKIVQWNHFNKTGINYLFKVLCCRINDSTLRMIDGRLDKAGIGPANRCSQWFLWCKFTSHAKKVVYGQLRKSGVDYINKMVHYLNLILK